MLTPETPRPAVRLLDPVVSPSGWAIRVGQQLLISLGSSLPPVSLGSPLPVFLGSSLPVFWGSSLPVSLGSSLPVSLGSSLLAATPKPLLHPRVTPQPGPPAPQQGLRLKRRVTLAF